MRRDDVKNPPFRAPKQETATIHAKKTAPTGPKRARPKSSAIVLLRETTLLSRTRKYDTFANKNRNYDGKKNGQRFGLGSMILMYRYGRHARVNDSGHVLSGIFHLSSDIICCRRRVVFVNLCSPNDRGSSP
jgi:hypothetical protein